MSTSVRFSSLLPPHYARRDVSGVWSRVLDAIGAVVDGLAADVDAFAMLQDYLACDAKYLPYLAQKLGWPLDTASPVALQRKMVGLLVPMYRERGTTQGIIDLLNLLLGVDVTIDEPWADGWRLGTAELGDDTILSPATPAVPYTSPLPYTFYVRFPRALTSAERAAARALLNFAKRAETHAVLVEPHSAPVPWVLGRTHIGSLDAFGAGAQLLAGWRTQPAPRGFWKEDTFAQYVGSTVMLVVDSESRRVGALVLGARYSVACDVPINLRQGNRTVSATADDFVLDPGAEWSLSPDRPSALYLAARALPAQASGTLRLTRVDADSALPARASAIYRL
jgi:phage tail-like protein